MCRDVVGGMGGRELHGRQNPCRKDVACKSDAIGEFEADGNKPNEAGGGLMQGGVKAKRWARGEQCCGP